MGPSGSWVRILAFEEHRDMTEPGSGEILERSGSPLLEYSTEIMNRKKEPTNMSCNPRVAKSWP